MKYKNIVFDFGNVVGRFDGYYILHQFCSSEEDYETLFPVLFSRWPELDRGTIDYDQYAKDCEKALPDHLKKACRSFFRNWADFAHPIPQTAEFIHELKKQGAGIYLLSNASTYFADYMRKNCKALEEFDGIVFSAPLKMAKPEPEIYRYLFRTYDLNPEECFFIDDLEPNIEAGRRLGMEGIVFTGDIDAVKKAVGF